MNEIVLNIMKEINDKIDNIESQKDYLTKDEWKLMNQQNIAYKQVLGILSQHLYEDENKKL